MNSDDPVALAPIAVSPAEYLLQALAGRLHVGVGVDPVRRWRVAWLFQAVAPLPGDVVAEREIRHGSALLDGVLKDAVAVHGPDGTDRSPFVDDPAPGLPGLVQGVRVHGPAHRVGGQTVRSAASSSSAGTEARPSSKGVAGSATNRTRRCAGLRRRPHGTCRLVRVPPGLGEDHTPVRVPYTRQPGTAGPRRGRAARSRTAPQSGTTERRGRKADLVPRCPGTCPAVAAPRLSFLWRAHPDELDVCFRTATIPWPDRVEDDELRWEWRIPRLLEADAADSREGGQSSGRDATPFPGPDSVHVIV